MLRRGEEAKEELIPSPHTAFEIILKCSSKIYKNTVKRLKLTSSLLLLLLTKGTEKNWNWPSTLPHNCTEKADIDPQLDTFSFVDNHVNVQTPFFPVILGTRKKGAEIDQQPNVSWRQPHLFQYLFKYFLLYPFSQILCPFSAPPPPGGDRNEWLCEVWPLRRQ